MTRAQVILAVALILILTSLVAVWVATTPRSGDFAILAVLTATGLLVWLVRSSEAEEWSALRKRRRFASAVEEDVEPDESESREGKSGEWSGTVRVWPTDGQAVMGIYPLRVRLGFRPVRMRLIRGRRSRRGAGVTAVEVVEHNRERNELGVRLRVGEGDREEAHIVTLRWKGGMWVTADPTARVTVTLKPAEAPVVHTCPA